MTFAVFRGIRCQSGGLARVFAVLPRSHLQLRVHFRRSGRKVEVKVHERVKRCAKSDMVRISGERTSPNFSWEYYRTFRAVLHLL